MMISPPFFSRFLLDIISSMIWAYSWLLWAHIQVRGSLIIRNLCRHLDAQSVYTSIASILSTEEDDEDALENNYEYDFKSIIVQTLNIILLTARELQGPYSIS